MNINIRYSQYKQKIYDLINLIDNYPDSNLSLHLEEITKILKLKGISACCLIIEEELIEHLNERYFEYEELMSDLYFEIFKALFFKGELSKKIRDEFIPSSYYCDNEREPTKREKLYEQILALKYDYDNLENDKEKNNFFNIFLQRFNDIKNFYTNMKIKGIDEKNQKFKLDQFDIDCFDELIGYLDNILLEMKEKKIQNQKEIMKKNQIKQNLNSVRGIPLKKRTFFYDKEKLIYGEDMQIEYKNYSFPFNDRHKEEFKRQICGFLNSKGGRLFIGITDNKVVNGILLNYHEKDKNTNEIVNLTYDFYPKCRTQVDVNFIPIKNNNNKYIKNLYVIKIIVSQGETNQLYSTISKGYISYLRLKGQCVLLTTEEIKKELLKRDKYPEHQINPNEFKDPEPDNPDLIQNTEFLEHQMRSMNIKDIKEYIPKNNYFEKDDDEDYELNQSFDEEESEEMEEIENEEIGGFRGIGVGRGRGFRGSRGGQRGINRNGKIYIKKFTVKVNFYSLSGINPSIKELNEIFSSIKCKKKFLNKGKNVFGFLNFNTKEEAMFFINSFNYDMFPFYQIKLIPKF